MSECKTHCCVLKRHSQKKYGTALVPNLITRQLISKTLEETRLRKKALSRGGSASENGDGGESDSSPNST